MVRFSSKHKLKLSVLSDCRAACYGFCAVWIVLFHARQIGCDFSFGVQGLSGINSLLALGNFGVDIFIFLSGVSCFYSWSKHQDSTIFLKKRLVRIVPSVLMICGTFWFLWVLTGRIHWTRMLYNATLVLPIFSDGSSGIWYVSAILLLYVAYPYIHAAIYGVGEKCSERSMLIRAVALCASVLLCFWMLHKYNLPLFRNIEIMVARVPTFCLGVYAGHIVKERKVFGSFSWLIALAASAMYAVYVAAAFSWVENNCWWWRVSMIPGGVIGAFAICNVVHCVNNIELLKPITAFLCLTGEFSLELYVAHVMCFWSRGLLPPIERSVGTVFLLSILSWFLAYMSNRLLYVWFDGGLTALFERRAAVVK